MWPASPVRLLLWRLLDCVWWLLPDKCEVLSCSRMGVRGNENVEHGHVVCDYCTSRLLNDLCVYVRRRRQDGGGFICLTHFTGVGR